MLRKGKLFGLLGKIEALTVRDAVLSAIFARLLWKWRSEYLRASASREGRPLKPLVVQAKDAPSWLTEDQPDIKSGYRRPCGMATCVCSCGCGHNESFNVWSHYVAAIWFLRQYRHNRKLPRWVALAAGCLYVVYVKFLI
jgi:hypothetical protein